MENRQFGNVRIYMRVKPVATVPGQLEGCDSPRSESPYTHWFRWRIFWAFVVELSLDKQ